MTALRHTLFVSVSTVSLLAASGAAAQAAPGGVEGFAGRIALTRAQSVPAFPKPAEAPKGAPNVVVILLDDVGFAATSTFGGLARTPSLDALAAGGVRLLMNTTVARFEAENGHIAAVVTSAGERIAADMALIGVGATPVTGLRAPDRAGGIRTRIRSLGRRDRRGLSGLQILFPARPTIVSPPPNSPRSAPARCRAPGPHPAPDPAASAA